MKNKSRIFSAFLWVFLSAVCIHAQTLDLQFPTINGEVKTICIHGNTIYIGGIFTLVGGQPRTNIAAIDIPTKSVTPWAPNVNEEVVDIAAADGKVYFCGEFTQVNSSSRNALAAVDSITGNVDPLNPAIVFPGIPGGMQTGTVTSVKVMGSNFYFAGYFISVNGAPRKNVAALDLPSGNLNAFSVNPDIPVNLIEIDGNTLYLGGPFFSVNGSDRKGFAAVNRITGNLLTWNPSSGNPGNTNYSILPDGDSILISGFFWELDGSNHCSLAKTDLNGNPSNWHPFSCVGPPNSKALAMVLLDSLLITGGSFLNFSGITRHNLVALDRHTKVVNDWNPSPDDEVLALAVNDSLIAVGGIFDHISGVTRPNFAVYRKEQAQTGIVEPAVLKINGFPNPARSTFTIPLEQNKVKNIAVYAGDGNKAHTDYQVQEQGLVIRTGTLPAGKYMVQIDATNGRRYVSTFIKVN